MFDADILLAVNAYRDGAVGSCAHTDLTSLLAGKGFRIRAHTGTVSEEGNTRKRTKVAGQQVPSAAKFTAPVEMPVELQSVGDVSLRADGNSGNGELLEPSRTQLSDLAQTAAKVGTSR